MKHISRQRWQVLFSLLTPLLIVAGDVALATEGHLLSVQDTQKILTMKGAKWEARENWVSRLPEQEIKRMLGLRTPPSTDIEFEAPQDQSLHFDSGLDWRDKDGVNWVTPVLNQGNCGSCVAFASVATLETQYNINSGIPGLDPSFSTEALFACGNADCDMGWWPDGAVSYMKNQGVPDEACDPYTMGATGVTSSCNLCADAASRTVKLAGSSTPSKGTKDIDGVKAALAHGPLITTLSVYADFINYSKGVYKHTIGDMLGGHAVSIVGYDDATRSWIIRNSWASDWGENGFAHISWDDISGVGEETWSLNLPSQQGYVSMNSPHGRVFVSGAAVQVEAESTFPQTAKLDVTLADSTGKAVKTITCAASPCSGTLDTTGLKDGKYQIGAKATWSGGTSFSQHQQIFVANSKPKLALTYSGAAGTNLGKPLVDRVVFNVNSSTGSDVPLSSIRFHAVQDGKEFYDRGTEIVLPKMTLGWRTPTVPNGNYDIFFSGELVTEQGLKTTVESSHMTVTVKNP